VALKVRESKVAGILCQQGVYLILELAVWLRAEVDKAKFVDLMDSIVQTR